MSNYSTIEELKVGLQFDDEIIPVDRLATRDNKIYFEYDSSFVSSSRNII